ncbi:unnamed protein product [Rotaria sp. Silwood1]|nr:unnamed protein product [Rotaria sp. Silwood1]CAF3651039.1 unnamed protein product [Rotaria sp. Silwood1]CAF4900273.1 unnamed protein product [Rotaria sp. Silwood1]CAF4974659.1 unnamed protein product [Rotaria sp. Silwood1]
MGDVFLRPMMNNLNKSRGSVSAIFGILSAVSLVTGSIATIFTNAYGCRKVTISGTCLATTGFLTSYFWANLWLYYLTIDITGVSILKKKRSFAMGIAVCGSGLGTMIFPAVMPYIINAPLWFDYEEALLFEAAIIFTSLIFGTLMIPLPQEPSEIRVVERKAQAAAKQQIFKTRSATNQNDNQQKQLLLTNQKKDETHSRSYENVSEIVKTNVPVAIARKDAIYQGRLHNIPLYNENTDEYHRQMIKTSDTINKKNSENAAFTLFVISNILTNLGFYVPYSFANDLAADAQVIEHKKHWIIMSIGIRNCFGRVIIGYLADRSWVNRLILYNITLISGGIVTMCAPFCNSFVQTHVIYAGLFGFFSGGYVDLNRWKMMIILDKFIFIC